jgi:hypothetical protein
MTVITVNEGRLLYYFFTLTALCTTDRQLDLTIMHRDYAQVTCSSLLHKKKQYTRRLQW